MMSEERVGTSIRVTPFDRASGIKRFSVSVSLRQRTAPLTSEAADDRLEPGRQLAGILARFRPQQRSERDRDGRAMRHAGALRQDRGRPADPNRKDRYA